MKSSGESSVTSSRSSAPVSRSLVSAVTPWALIRIRLRMARPTGIRHEHRAQRVFELSAQVEEQADAQGEEQNVTSLDDQRLGSVGPGHELTPEDRVGPGVAIRPGAGATRRWVRAGRANRWSARRSNGLPLPRRTPARRREAVANGPRAPGLAAVTARSRPVPAPTATRDLGLLFLDLDQRLVSPRSRPRRPARAARSAPGSTSAASTCRRPRERGEGQPDADVDQARRPHHPVIWSARGYSTAIIAR